MSLPLSFDSIKGRQEGRKERKKTLRSRAGFKTRVLEQAPPAKKRQGDPVAFVVLGSGSQRVIEVDIIEFVASNERCDMQEGPGGSVCQLDSEIALR